MKLKVITLPNTLIKLRIDECENMKIPSLNSLSKLEGLEIIKCPLLHDLDLPLSITDLTLNECPNLCTINHLHELKIAPDLMLNII